MGNRIIIHKKNLYVLVYQPFVNKIATAKHKIIDGVSLIGISSIILSIKRIYLTLLYLLCNRKLILKI